MFKIISSNQKYTHIEDNLVNYMKLRARKLRQYKCVASWLFLKENCQIWAKDLKINDFRCSGGWVDRSSEHHGMKIVHLYGEAGYMNKEEF